MNQFYHGDNVLVLRTSIAAESVDLIYLDPPFNPKGDYLPELHRVLKRPRSLDLQCVPIP